MVVSRKYSSDWRVRGRDHGLAKRVAGLKLAFARRFMRTQKTDNPVLHSGAWFPSGLAHEINSSQSDVVNLHWIAGETISIEEISRIRKPVVWTLHDMWPFCGAEHYAPDEPMARWINGYDSTNREAGARGLDINGVVWRRKKRAWSRPSRVVAPSRWLADCASRSYLMQHWSIYTIPNPIDTAVFKPIEKEVARSLIGLPQHKKIILFGAAGGSADSRKGFDLLESALRRLSSEVDPQENLCVIVGELEPLRAPTLGLPTRWMGRFCDDYSMAVLYSAADVVVVPSRQDNLPQSGTEAQACGCPVVAFNTSGLPDVVVHRETGYLATPFDVEDLAEGIGWVLEDAERADRLSCAARERAVRLWSHGVVVPQYLEVYRQAIEAHST